MTRRQGGKGLVWIPRPHIFYIWHFWLSPDRVTDRKWYYELTVCTSGLQNCKLKKCHIWSIQSQFITFMSEVHQLYTSVNLPFVLLTVHAVSAYWKQIGLKYQPFHAFLEMTSVYSLTLIHQLSNPRLEMNFYHQFPRNVILLLS